MSTTNSSQRVSVLVVELSLPTCPPALLDQVAVPATDRPALLARLVQSPAVLEAVVLSTPSRTEVYAAVRERRDAAPFLLDVLARSGATPAVLRRHAHVLRGDAAVRAHGPVLRRRAPVELRRVRISRSPARVRHQ